MYSYGQMRQHMNRHAEVHIGPSFTALPWKLNLPGLIYVSELLPSLPPLDELEQHSHHEDKDASGVNDFAWAFVTSLVQAIT